MGAYQLSEFNYQFGMTVATLVQAIGMFSENMQRQQLGQSIAYTEVDFDKLLRDNGVNHNSLVESGRRINA